MKGEYNGKLPDWAFGKYAGLFQQYLFYYEVNHKQIDQDFHLRFEKGDK